MFATTKLNARSGWLCGAAALGAVVASNPATARADHFSFGLSIGAQPVWVPPVYETRPAAVVVPPACEERVRQVWREPIYEERQVLVDVPARVAVREVPRFDRWGRLIGYDRIREVVEPAHREWRTERVLVTPGRWETVVERVCDGPEMTRVLHDDVVVAPGHWEGGGRLAIGFGSGPSPVVRPYHPPMAIHPAPYYGARVRH